MPLLVTHSPHKPPHIEGEARGYGPAIAGEGAIVRAEGEKLTLETDLFATRPLHVLVRDGHLWAADSLHRLTRVPGNPRGLLPMGICTALCNAPSRRPSLCASGLSLLPATRTVSEGGKIQTTALGRPDARRGDIYVAPTEALTDAVQTRVSSEPHVLFDGPLAEPLLDALRGRGATAWIMARDGVDVSTLASRAQQLCAEPEIITVPEEDLPTVADDAIRACETLIADSSAVALFALFRQARVPEMLSAAGAAELFSGDGLALRDGIPEFVARLQPECELAHFFLRPEWAKRVQRHDWRKEFAGKQEEAARELLLRTMLPHHTLPELVLTARAHGVAVRLPWLDRDVVALRGSCTEERGQSPAGTVPLSSRARRNWILWLDARLSFERLERLEVIDSGKVRRELIQYGKLHTEAPRRVLLERVFFKLASLTVLQEWWT